MKKILLIVLVTLLLVSCNENKINDNVNLSNNDVNLIEAQAPSIIVNDDLLIKITNDFNKEKNSNEYVIKHIFKIYGDSIVLVLGLHNKIYLNNSFILYSFDDISFVVPSFDSDYYLLVYNNGKFMRLNQAYDNKLLFRDDLLDLKLYFDDYYYDNDLWYERIIFKCMIQKNKKYVESNYTIVNGIRIENYEKDNLINYDFTKSDYDHIIDLFIEAYGSEYQMTISLYYGDINGVKLLRMSPIKYAGINRYYYVGHYKFPTEHEYDKLYVVINDKLYSLEEAFRKNLIGEDILRFAAFYTYLQKINGRVFGNSGEYVNYNASRLMK